MGQVPRMSARPRGLSSLSENGSQTRGCLGTGGQGSLQPGPPPLEAAFFTVTFHPHKAQRRGPIGRGDCWCYPPNMAVVNIRPVWGRGVFTGSWALTPATLATVKVLNSQGSGLGSKPAALFSPRLWNSEETLPPPPQAHPPLNQTEQYLFPPPASPTAFFLVG